MKVTTNEFKCPNCNYYLYRSSQKEERVPGYSSIETTIDCERCKSKFLVIGNKIITFIKTDYNPKSKKNTKKRSENDVPFVTYVVGGAVLLGGLCFIMQAITNKSNQNSFNNTSSAERNSVYYEPISRKSSGDFEALASVFVAVAFMLFAFRFIRKLFN
ncbi:MAG: hypothetical protein EOO42_15070 [Flavobacteriales bacterium]|nr:MAG: hypothetical protein EOO42_15070 [Flavobacteriales bacterium]